MILTVQSDIAWFITVADDTNLLSYNNLVKSMNKQIHQDLRNLTSGLNTNEIRLNFSKTEVVLFKTET